MDTSNLYSLKLNGLQDSLLGSIDADDTKEAGKPVVDRIGLSKDQANRLLDEYGKNEPENETRKQLAKLTSFMWAPVSVLMYVAIFVEILDQRWTDVALLVVLLLGIFGWALTENIETAIVSQNVKSDNFQLQVWAKRDGRFKLIDNSDLVPGDVIRFKTGDIIPADLVLLEGPPVDTDQSELTGECMPVVAYPGDAILMGTVVKFGTGEGYITATGSKTTLGKAERKLPPLNMRLGKIQIGLYQVATLLAVICAGSCIGIVASMVDHNVGFARALGTAVLLTVACIPFATNILYKASVHGIERKLGRKGIAVTKPELLENMAGLDIVLVDKSKIITEGNPEIIETMSEAVSHNITVQTLLFFAYLSVRKNDGVLEPLDPIDSAVEKAAQRSPGLLASFAQFETLDNQSFDAMLKYSEATVRDPAGRIFKAMKGQVKVILNRCAPTPELESRVANIVRALAEQQYRCIGVARTDIRTNKYEFLGVLAMGDAVHAEAKAAIRRAADMGVEFRLVTGDHLFVSKTTCKSVGIGANLINTEFLDEGRENVVRELVARADGYADVFPDQKLTIVQLLQDQGISCGVTGNCVEESGAMRVAVTGIALPDATAAVKAAAVVLLSRSGAKDIVECLKEARKIFIRLRTFCIYRISAAMGFILLLFFAGVCFQMSEYFPESQRKSDTSVGLFNGSHEYDEVTFVLPTIAVVMFCIMNNIMVIAICK
jgi:H+-transporting ATPase